MTTVTCAAYREFGKLWGNEPGYIRLTYDFANDGGVHTHTAFYLGKAIADTVILDSLVVVEDAVVGAGSKMKIGTTRYPDSFLSKSHGEPAYLTADARFEGTLKGQKMAADDQVIMVLSLAAVTAGKVHVYLKYANL